jgi:sugar lactone lactonase YvrE
MKNTRILLLIALVAGLGLMPGWESTSAAQTCQQEGACFVIESQGYSTDPGTGQTTITFRVTNKCRNAVGYVAIGTEGFTRVAPANGSIYTGNLGPYNVSWTRASGNPAFESVKFAATLKNFANFASDTFSIVVSNFNPATMMMVQGKADTAQETYSFLLSQTCGTPTPTPTPTRHIYWSNNPTGTIGRADADGQNVNQNFITGAVSPYGVAVDSSHIYWTNLATNTIGRADLDGQNVDQNFITTDLGPVGVAVDSSHIYWTNFYTDTIGRADLDGQNVNQNFITGSSYPAGLAVDGSHIYWTHSDTIGRADLDGQNVNQNFISVFHPSGLAVDSSYIYWTTGFNTAFYNPIGRADLDGQNVNQNFITGASIPAGVAVDSSHIYWANSYLTYTIGRADLDGQNVSQSFITGAFGPLGVAVDPE